MNNSFFKKLFLGFSIKEKVAFANKLAFLIHAGIPIVESLKVIRKQSLSNHKDKVLDKVIADVSSGQYLSTSLSRFKHVFDHFAISLIRIGEESGTLDENLTYLADSMKKKQALRRKVVSALIYPIFIIIATFGIAGLLTVYIFPKILPIFASLSVTLPITTRILIWTSNFLENNGLYLLVALVALLISIPAILQINKVKFQWHKFILVLPLLGGIFKNYFLANICRTLGILLKSDIRIVRAFTVTADVTSNLVYRKELGNISQALIKGEKITSYMIKRPKLFSHIMTHTLDVGETTGRLDETLIYLAEMYEADLEEQTKNLSTILEPALMIFMGIIVGFIAVSIITPIYEITQHLQPR